MSEQHPAYGADTVGHDGDTPWWHADNLLDPGPSALAALALSVLVLFGNNLMLVGSQAVVGNVFSFTSDLRGYLVTTGVGTLVPVALSLVLARRALTTGTASAAEATIARAAVLLSLVAVVYAVLTVAGGLLHASGNSLF